MLRSIRSWIPSRKASVLGAAALVALGSGLWYAQFKPRVFQTLHILLRTDPGAEEQFRALTGPFLEKNPHIKIEYHALYANQWIPGKTSRLDHWDPNVDLVIGSASQGRHLCSLGHVQCETRPDMQKGLAEDLQKMVEVDGRPVGYPLTYTDFMVLYSNQSILKTLPAGREALANALSDWKLQAPNRIGLGLADDASSNHIFLPLSELTKNASPDALHTATLEGYVLRGYYQLDRGLTPQFCDEPCVLNLLQDGKAPAIVASSMHLRQLQKALGSKLALHSVSALGDASFVPASTYDGRFVFRARAASHPELEALIRDLTSPEAQTQLMNLSGQLAARVDASIDPKGPYAPYLQTLRTTVQPALVQVPAPAFDRLLSRHDEVLALHQSGKLTNQQAAATFLSAAAPATHP